MRKRVPWAGILAVMNVVLCGWALVSYLHLDLRVALANDQTRFFAKWRDEALASKKEEGVGSLLRLVYDYPSGTKQLKGSALDQMVERQRASAVREVLAHLRKETGQDLGNDPEVWIEKYAGK